MLGLKFQVLPRTEEFQIYVALNVFTTEAGFEILNLGPHTNNLGDKNISRAGVAQSV